MLSHFKTEEDVAAGIIESANKKGNKPNTADTDDEGAISTESVQTYFKERKIEHNITRAHPNFSQRDHMRLLKIHRIGEFKQMRQKESKILRR